MKKISIFITSFFVVLCFVCAFGEENLLLNPNTKNIGTPSIPANNPLASVPAPPIANAKAYVLMDAATGQVLAQSNMQARLAPASLTKLMTLYLIFQALQNKQIQISDPVYVSENAWRIGGSKMFIRVGTKVPVDQLIQGIAVASGNDACVAMAEYIAGSEGVFANMMNQIATLLGMKNSHFKDSNGLPDPDHYTTAYDMALLTKSLINNFPQYYPYFSEKWFSFNNIKQPNRNRLLWRDLSVDGLKTGHTDDAGYCLIASAKRDGMRLISVVLGAPSDKIRANDTEALLNYGFRFYRSYRLFGNDKPITTTRTWLGQNKYTPLGLEKPLYITVPAQTYDQLKAEIHLQDKMLKAPLVKGNTYGQIQISLKDKPLLNVPLIALEDNPKGGITRRLSDHLSMMISKWFTLKS